MIDLRIAASDLHALHAGLLGFEFERCAVLFAARHEGGPAGMRLLVRDVALPTDEDYALSRIDHAQLKPAFVARVAKRARLENLSLIFVHSHPGAQPPEFSAIDDAGESELADFLIRRGQTSVHGALVISGGGVRARVLGGSERIRVTSIGDRVRLEYEPTPTGQGTDDQFDRQVRAFGSAGQAMLQGLRVGIVGLGGTGSIVAQQLVHLGVRSFVLVDPDHLESTNLNRVVSARPGDVGRPKVSIAQAYLEEFSPKVNVQSIVGNVVHSSVAHELVDVDVLFCCTDSHGSRSVVQQIAYQFLIPCIDIGSTIAVQAGQVTGVFGRVQLLGPDRPCLWCTELLSSEEVRRDLMSEFERRQDPYIPGAHEPAPAVISLNGTVVSLAITMLLSLFTSVPLEGRHLIYNARAPSLRSVRGSARVDCFICSRRGVFGRGDDQALFARQD